jgi:hypothetical protein
VQQSPGKQDLVNVSVTDFAGRATQQYLPYASGNDGSYQKDALIRQPAFYQTLKNDNNALAESRFEPSPLNRPIEQGSPGGALFPVALHPTSKLRRKRGQ